MIYNDHAQREFIPLGQYIYYYNGNIYYLVF